MSTSEERPYACEYCDKRFKDALTHKRHTNVQHTQEESHVCDYCGTVFYAKYKLDTHLASKHGINDQHKCEKCNKFLMSEGSLIKHRVRCSTLSCPVCGKEFISKWKMQNHMNGHLNNKCHICELCGKDFLHPSSLVDHIETVHQGKRPFNCESCQKTFTRKGSLRAHRLIHAGIKPFSCTFCANLFREKSQLIKHLQKKHKVEDTEMSNYVKVMPKKEIIMKEDAQRVLQAILNIKTEPDHDGILSYEVKDEPASLDNMNVDEMKNSTSNLSSENEECEVKTEPENVVAQSNELQHTDMMSFSQFLPSES